MHWLKRKKKKKSCRNSSSCLSAVHNLLRTKTSWRRSKQQRVGIKVQKGRKLKLTVLSCRFSSRVNAIPPSVFTQLVEEGGAKPGAEDKPLCFLPWPGDSGPPEDPSPSIPTSLLLLSSFSFIAGRRKPENSWERSGTDGSVWWRSKLLMKNENRSIQRWKQMQWQ